MTQRRWAPSLLLCCFSLLLACDVVHARAPIRIIAPPQDPTPYLIDAIPPGENFVQDEHYNDAAYGLFVNQSFKSSSLLAPRLNFEMPFTACDDGSYIFLTPRGEKTKSSAAIVDANGSLIWKPEGDYGQIYNFQVVRHHDEDYIAFWAGDSNGGHGDGAYYMFDKHYRSYRNVTAVDGVPADLHSFAILPNGNALVTIYVKTQTDLRSVVRVPHVGQDWIWDAVFQEYNLDTGELVFEWCSLGHFPLTDSYTPVAHSHEEDPWDWFHINTVEKDALGNYLVSARHLRCIAYISGTTGEVLWRLGGKSSDFTDLSDGHTASDFVGQHDTHFDYDPIPNDKLYITTFDNRADWDFEIEHVSRGKRIEVNLTAMTVDTHTLFTHPRNIFAFSQGSYQTLPNHNVLLGYGYTGALTEFSPNGTVLCDAYLQPASRFSSGDVQSYRNLKFNWTGIPLTPPAVAYEQHTIYASWHGSTELRQWRLLHAHSPTAAFEPLVQIPKSGFETAISPDDPSSLRRYIRVDALDAQGAFLASSPPLDTLLYAYEDEEVEYDSDQSLTPPSEGDITALFFVAFLATLAAMTIFRLLVSRRRGHVAWRDVVRRVLRFPSRGVKKGIVITGSSERSWVERERLALMQDEF